MSTNTQPRTHAVVLGGGLAGMLAASVLTGHVDKVTVVERDRLPDGPEPRKGVPQARHVHMLWSGGARAIEALVPGTIDRLTAAGARRHGVPDGLVALSPDGWWIRQRPEMQFLLAASRDLLDWVIREQVCALPGIDLMDGTAVEGLLGDATRVTGVEVRDQETGGSSTLEADLVVDATGRSSRIRPWLDGLGLPPVPVETVDCGLAYATRIFRALEGVTDFPVVNVQAFPEPTRPGRGAVLVPIEKGKWIVTVAGTRGAHPTDRDDDFEAYARSTRHPVIADLIARAEPLTSVRMTHSTVNRRLFFERLPTWPAGLLVIGDAVATYNPAYGHGMSVAAYHATCLGDGLAKHGLAPQATRRIQRSVTRAVNDAWAMATTQDILYPEAEGRPPNAATRMLQRYMERMSKAATCRPTAMRAMLDALSLSAPTAKLLAPRVAAITLLGPNRPPLADPPLTESERALIPAADGKG
ncbi:pyridine nucleotide-disulfide oxidoreductase [Wenjunlia vitaminophila]|uniref:Pyridine nucleotide-disulfide oxidoreductase n=1 Tax=Wenjunlia vitaminophila TaxID=76728 RepID=A0A0T6LSZ4_WENVI|nr:FAD-dependent monooxygenase [Wenjunlia vitaminophila]KRV49124.1 pyridine nucleotide-disulfide oxidoreductase [Wenjunlia vitaminophila]